MNFKEAKRLRDLIVVEGLVLLAEVELNGKTYLLNWADVVEGKDIYLAFEVNPQYLDAYVNKHVSLRIVQNNAPHIFFGHVEAMNYIGSQTSIASTLVNIEAYLASVDAYYDDSFKP